MRSIVKLASQTFVCLGLMWSAAEAQTITGSFTGTVTDASGAVVPNAKVTATNTGTNVTFTGITTEAGLYNLLFLPIGQYRISVESQGFKTSQLGPFRLETNQIARVDVGMEIGDSAQSIEISSVAPVLQTDSTQTGEVLASSKLTSIPLNGRNFVSLTLLIPGAVSPNPAGMNSRFGARPYVNGNREQTNNFMLDGVDVNDSIDNRVGYSPNVDALEEVKVLTGNAAAEFGNSGGATVMLQLKSGTNELHGNVFGFLRNNALDANGYFRNRNANTARRLGVRQQIFGGTLGGPIRKNKAFFFVDYEGTRRRTDGPASAQVAPLAWRNGDLSAFTNTINDPLTGLPFPGKQIPVSRFSSVARTLFNSPDLYPLPNQAGAGPLGIIGNYGSSTARNIDNHQADAKIDIRLGDKDTLMGRWSIGRFEDATVRQPLPVQMVGTQSGPTQSAVINWTRTFTPTIVNEARVSYSRIVIRDNTVDWSGLLGADGNARFGIPGGQAIPGLSSIAVGGGLTTVGSLAALSNTADNKFIYYNNLTWQKGTHLVKFGGQAMRYQQNRYYSGNNGVLGTFGYGGGFTGLDFSDFLLDQLASKGRGALTGTWGHRYWRNALFVQDDWRISSTFTLNIGMRWEYMQPIYEVADRQVNVDTFGGKLLYPSQTTFGRALYSAYPNQFMPRIGFAWNPTAKLVVRAGYAYQSFMEGTGANLRLPLNPPFFVESNVSYSAASPGSITAGFGDIVTDNVTLDGPRPPGVTAPQLQGRAWDLNLRPQTTQQVNFTLEYQFDNATSVSAGYVGQRGTHLVAPVEGNQPLPGVGAPNTWAPINDRRPLINSLPNLSNIARTESSATMDYHALQTSVRRRLGGGIEFLAAYTFGKTLTDNLGYYGSALTQGEGAYWQNAYDRRGNRGPAFFDVRHNFTVAGTWAVPYGRGQKFGSSGPAIVDLLIGGWSVNFNVAARTGLPITVRGADGTLQAVRGNVRANAYRPMTIDESRQTIDNWFGLPDDRQSAFCVAGVDNGSCAYGNPASGQFGSSGIGTERGPGFFNFDTSIGKRFNVSERTYFDFRAEFFNVLNHVSWAPPPANLTNFGAFGVVTAQVQDPRNIQFGLKYIF